MSQSGRKHQVLIHLHINKNSTNCDQCQSTQFDQGLFQNHTNRNLRLWEHHWLSLDCAPGLGDVGISLVWSLQTGNPRALLCHRGSAGCLLVLGLMLREDWPLKSVPWPGLQLSLLSVFYKASGDIRVWISSQSPQEGEQAHFPECHTVPFKRIRGAVVKFSISGSVTVIRACCHKIIEPIQQIVCYKNRFKNTFPQRTGIWCWQLLTLSDEIRVWESRLKSDVFLTAFVLHLHQHASFCFWAKCCHNICCITRMQFLFRSGSSAGWLMLKALNV